jgi:hypothetical protein
MSKIAKHLVKAIFEWCDDPTSPSGFDAAEAAIDKALEGKIIKKSELDGLRRDAVSRTHTVIPVSEHETIKLLKAQKKELADVWAAKYDELAAENRLLRDETDRLRNLFDEDTKELSRLYSEIRDLKTVNNTLRDEIARRIDLDIARSACVDIEPPACLGPLDSLVFVNAIIQNDGLERISA